MDDTSGAREWVGTLVQRHETALVRYALSIVGDVEAARDVVQDTFLRLWQVDRSRLEGGETAWLFTVCRNRARDVARKERRMNVMDEARAGALPAGDPDPAALAELGSAHAEALRLLATMPANQQEVVRLRFQSGLSYREISAVTGNSVTNVGFLIHTAIKALRAQMAPGNGTHAPERSLS